MDLQPYHAAAKAKHPDTLILFRVGDFCEACNDDARTLAKVCGLTLTVSGDHALAGFMSRNLEAYLRKLIVAGCKVAICEPLAKPDGGFCGYAPPSISNRQPGEGD